MTRLSIPDMTCSHCVATVQHTLAALAGPDNVRVDLAALSAEVRGPVPAATLLAALDHAGYPAHVLP